MASYYVKCGGSDPVESQPAPWRPPQKCEACGKHCYDSESAAKKAMRSHNRKLSGRFHAYYSVACRAWHFGTRP